MSLTYTQNQVYEFKNSGILLMKTPSVLLGKWALIFTNGKKEILVFSEIHYMKHTNEGLVLVTTTYDTIKIYTIEFHDYELNHCTIDLYEWIREKVCPSLEQRSAT